MGNFREQAEQYARALPTERGWPPFILIANVGHAIEIIHQIWRFAVRREMRRLARQPARRGISRCRVELAN